MASSAASIGLTDKGNLPVHNHPDEPVSAPFAVAFEAARQSERDRPFLCIPPFPGAMVRNFGRTRQPADFAGVPEAVRSLRVGGAFWGAQPALPEGCVLVRSSAAVAVAEEIASGRPIVLWQNEPHAGADPRQTQILGECDPWHLVSSAFAVVASDPEDDLRVIAALLKVPCYIRVPATGEASLDSATELSVLRRLIGGSAFENPFTGEPMTLLETVELCGFWRKLIDSNRDLYAGLGFAFWKQPQIEPLLWGGTGRFGFVQSASDIPPNSPVALWRTRVAPAAVADLESKGAKPVEVEDGFLRSRGLGADCVPPLSVCVDRSGIHFDPARPSDLERLIERGGFDPAVVERASVLRRLIVESGLAKYGQGTAVLERPAGDRRHILVPGQVEDDRAVVLGGCGLASNLELLKLVREQAPDAYIIYKPHPDVVAGHRRGAVPGRLCLRYADQIAGDLPIASLLAMVDEVHVNSSLAGFEALLRGKRVTVYGVPFYAGWGLTRDLGPVPARRTARRSIDELVAATLLLYPRYIDPLTGLPCPAEIAVARLTSASARHSGMLVGVRRLQGKLMRRLRNLVQ